MEENKAYKPDYIENQVNNNCHQFFGQVSGCVFAMPGSTVNMPEHEAADSPKGACTSQNEEILARRIQAVHEMNGLNRADWGVVHRLLSMDGKFLQTQYDAGAKYINEVCGEEVTSERAIAQSQAITNIDGYHPNQWKFREVTRESDGILTRYKQIAKIYMEA